MKAATALHCGETIEVQEWSIYRRFPGRIVVEERAEALVTGRKWRRRDTIWTDGSRLDSSEVGAACVGQSLGGRTGSRLHVGTNKEVFVDAEVFAIYQALRVVGQRQETGHRHTIFVDSTAVIDRVRADTMGPGQQFAIATMKVCGRVFARDNEVTIRWVPAHHRVLSNEKPDEFARAAAGRTAPCSDDEVPDELRREASLSHMSRSATEARSRTSAERISSHIGAERRYRLPPGRGLRRKHLRGTRKELAGR